MLITDIKASPRQVEIHQGVLRPWKTDDQKTCTFLTVKKSPHSSNTWNPGLTITGDTMKYCNYNCKSNFTNFLRSQGQPWGTYASSVSRRCQLFSEDSTLHRLCIPQAGENKFHREYWGHYCAKKCVIMFIWCGQYIYIRDNVARELVPYLSVSLMHPLRNGIFCNVAAVASSSGCRTELTSS